jgi:1,4-alpha-glucan branching enzyme
VAIGAIYLGGGKTAFRVWAPAASAVAVHLISPKEQVLALEATGRGEQAALTAVHRMVVGLAGESGGAPLGPGRLG